MEDICVDYDTNKRYLLERIASEVPPERPFRHLFIREFLPAGLYSEVAAYCRDRKANAMHQDRLQDNSAFVNRRYSLVSDVHPAIAMFRRLFSDPDVKQALLSHFYLTPDSCLVDDLSIHSEFEFTFTKAGRHQNIHVDIPPKFLSFVFYLPEEEFSRQDAEQNATLLYDRNLSPVPAAAYEANSACVFAPHFNSYHGFSSTRYRDVLVMFYISQEYLEKWWDMNRAETEQPPYTAIRDLIEAKLRDHTLVEFGRSENRILSERAGCLINAPLGRVMQGL